MKIYSKLTLKYFYSSIFNKNILFYFCSDYATWLQNITNSINSTPQTFQPIQNYDYGISTPIEVRAKRQTLNNVNIPEICTTMQKNIDTNGFQRGRLIRKKRSNGRG